MSVGVSITPEQLLKHEANTVTLTWMTPADHALTTCHRDDVISRLDSNGTVTGGVGILAALVVNRTNLVYKKHNIET